MDRAVKQPGMHLPRQRLTRQARRLGPWLAILVGGSGALLGGVLLLASVNQIEPGSLTRDPTAVAGVPFYVGIVSTAGVMVWGAIVAVCALGCWIVRAEHARPGEAGERREASRFLFASACFTALLGADDAFLLHESVLPEVFGVPERAVLVTYLGVFAVLAWRFARFVLRSEFLLLTVGLGLLGGSLAVDKLVEFEPLSTFFEDGLKFTGMVVWLGYYSRTSAHAIRSLQVPRAKQNDRGGSAPQVTVPKRAA